MRDQIDGVTFDGIVHFGADEVQRYHLDNGLKILLLVDKSAPVVSYYTWFSVGSRHEKEGKTGLAHLFEHLMFNESGALKAGEFDRRMEEAGGETNAATWVDWTYYYESIPAASFPLVVKLESGRMSHLVLREPQVASEKEVVANELNLFADGDGESLPASPVVFAAAVFDRDERILFAQASKVVDLLWSGEFSTVGVNICSVLVELRCCCVDAEIDREVQGGVEENE